MDPTVLSFLLQGTALGLSAAASPGPLQALLISETLLGGFRRGARVTLAPLVSDAPIIVLATLALRRVPPPVVQVLSMAGGLFVLYLAWGLARQWRAAVDRDLEVANKEAIGWQGLRRAVALNYLNPYPYAFWLLVSGPILVAALSESVVHGAAFLVSFYGIFVGGMLVVAALFHHVRRLGPRVVRGMLLLSIVILVAFGALLIGRGWSAGA